MKLQWSDKVCLNDFSFVSRIEIFIKLSSTLADFVVSSNGSSSLISSRGKSIKFVWLKADGLVILSLTSNSSSLKLKASSSSYSLISDSSSSTSTSSIAGSGLSWSLSVTSSSIFVSSSVV